jgi:hypothetical protein
LTWLTPDDPTSLEHDILVGFGVLVTLVGLPAMVALVLVMVVPDVESVTSRRDNVVAIGAVALVVALSYTLGTQHPHLLTCEDFKISGNNEPTGCITGTGVIGLRP